MIDLKKFRNERDLNQGVVAKKIDMTRSMISKFENGDQGKNITTKLLKSFPELANEKYKLIEEESLDNQKILDNQNGIIDDLRKLVDQYKEIVKIQSNLIEQLREQ